MRARRSRSWRWVAAILALLAAGSAAALEVPFLAGRVNDLAGILSSDAESRIEDALRRLEEDTGAQVVVLTISGLEGDDLEDFSLRVAETWALGRRGVDDGALLLVARDDRKMRLEVGYGLEAVLTDAVSGRILDGAMRPRFRAGDFDGGIESAIAAIEGLVRGDDSLVPAEDPAGGHGPGELAGRGLVAVFFLAIVGLFSLQALFSTGCTAWFLYLFLIPFWSAFPIGLLGLPVGTVFPIAWIVGFPILYLLVRKTGWGERVRSSGRWGRTLTSGGSWSSSGGWSSGGGFSGGGGSFGGGGASSSW